MRKYPTKKEREERRELILAALGNDRMTAKEMAEKLKMSERTIRLNMSLMLNQGYLHVSGSARGSSGHEVNVYSARMPEPVAPSWIPKQEWFSALESV